MKNEIKTVFKGVATAAVTPFSGGRLDLPSFERILEYQLENGIKAIVVCGTTGEASVLSEGEKRELFECAADILKGRAVFIAGCGSNDTAKACRLAAVAETSGADALLCVTPYYNKATEWGLCEHFKCVAAATNLPMILYNVPSRTGVDIPVTVYNALSEVENIVGIKEASGNVGKSAVLLSLFSDRYSLYSGCDDITLPLYSLGAVGTVSVLSGVFPRESIEIYRLSTVGDYPAAARLFARLLPFTKALFSETNPVPVKTVLSEMGLCRPEFRLPLSEMEEKKKKKLLSEFEKLL